MHGEGPLPLFASKRIPDHPHEIHRSYASSHPQSQETLHAKSFLYIATIFILSFINPNPNTGHCACSVRKKMAQSKNTSPSFALFLSINVLFFALASGCNSCGYPKPTPSPTGSCPRDALKLGVCANLLNAPVNAVIGSPPDTPCCSVLEGLLNLEAAVCLCTAIKANVLGINLNIPISLSLLVNTCGKKLPSDFQCP